MQVNQKSTRSKNTFSDSIKKENNEHISTVHLRNKSVEDSPREVIETASRFPYGGSGDGEGGCLGELRRSAAVPFLDHGGFRPRRTAVAFHCCFRLPSFSQRATRTSYHCDIEPTFFLQFCFLLFFYQYNCLSFS